MKDGFDNFNEVSFSELPDVKPIETSQEGVTFWQISEVNMLVDLELLPEDESSWIISLPHIGDRELDGMMWKYCETQAMAAHQVFSVTTEVLTGEGIEEQKPSSRYLADLSRNCTVITSDINSVGETVSRTVACLSDHGCVIAMVPDSQWRTLMNLEPTGMWDSGIRVIQFTGTGPQGIFINDPMHSTGRQMLLTVPKLERLQGILLEVYK